MITASRLRTVDTLVPGLALAAAGAVGALGIHHAVPAAPTLSLAILLGVGAANLPRARRFVQGAGGPGLSLAGRGLMRLGIVLLGYQVSPKDLMHIGGATVVVVITVVIMTLYGTYRLGRRLGLRGDQPFLIAVGYSICGASAIGAVGEARRSEESDRAASIALVTLCGTLAIVVLPLLQHPLGLDDADFGRWVGASVHDVGQVVATAQGAGAEALREAVVVKLMRVLLLAPLVAVVAARSRRQGREAGTTQTRPPLVPLFVAGFVGAMALRASGLLPAHLLTPVGEFREIVMAVALVGLGSSVHLPSLTKSGARLALLGLFAWAVIAGASFVGVKLTA